MLCWKFHFRLVISWSNILFIQKQNSITQIVTKLFSPFRLIAVNVVKLKQKVQLKIKSIAFTFFGWKLYFSLVKYDVRFLAEEKHWTVDVKSTSSQPFAFYFTLRHLRFSWYLRRTKKRFLQDEIYTSILIAINLRGSNFIFLFSFPFYCSLTTK